MKRSELLELMKPQISDIVHQWDTHGILFEQQFSFASSVIMKNNVELIYSLLKEYGGHSIKATFEEDVDVPLCKAIETTGMEYMYAIFDPTMVDTEVVGKLIKDHYK